MRRLRHLRMPTSLVHARTSATSLVHAHTFLAVFVGIKLRIWSFGFRVYGVFGVSGWGRDDLNTWHATDRTLSFKVWGVLGVSGFRGGVVMTFVLLEDMACHRQDTFFEGLGGFGFRVLGLSGFFGVGS